MTDPRGPPESWRTKIAIAVATVFGLGSSPRAPGTMGSLAALPVVWWLREEPWWILATLVLVITGVGIVAAELAGRYWRQEDDQRIVIDETAGTLLTFVAVPVSPATLLVGFLLFRGFDIVKPPPLRWLDERCPGGLGVMLDDLGAGLYARIVLLFWLGT